MQKIVELLSEKWLERVALVGLVIVFIYSGVDKTLNFEAARAEYTALNLHPAALLVGLTIVAQLAGSILLFSRRYAMWGGLILAAFTAMATLVAHRFWSAPPSAYVSELNAFLEHLGLIGAFLLIAHFAAIRHSRPRI